MKFLLSGLFISLAVSLSAAKPACYWDFDNINPKTRAPLSNNGIHYYNALIIENGGVNGTNGLLCNGKRRNQIVLPLDCKEWTAELKFKLDRADSADSRYLFAYEHAAWNLARFLLYIDRNGRLTGDFRRLKMPEKTVEKQFIFSSEKRAWQPEKWYTVRAGWGNGRGQRQRACSFRLERRQKSQMVSAGIIGLQSTEPVESGITAFWCCGRFENLEEL